jgi:hypothetical protein
MRLACRSAFDSCHHVVLPQFPMLLNGGGRKRGGRRNHLRDVRRGAYIERGTGWLLGSATQSERVERPTPRSGSHGQLASSESAMGSMWCCRTKAAASSTMCATPSQNGHRHAMSRARARNLGSAWMTRRCYK